MNSNKISSFEAVCLICVVILGHLILNIPQTILNTCGSSSLINIIYITIISILFFLLINKLYKNFSNMDIIDISNYLGGFWLKIIIGTIIMCYILFSSSILLRNAIETLKIIYYFKTSSSFIVLFFLISPIVANLLGEQVISRCNIIITPIMIIFLLIAFISISPLLTYQRIFPILGYGANKTFGEGLENIFAFNGLLVLLLLLPMLSNKSKYKKIGITSIIITGFLLLLFVGTMLLAFPFSLSVESIEPIYLIVMNTQFSEFLQRPEAIFVLVWIIFFMSYLNIIVLYILRIFRKITNISKPKSMVIPICTLIFIATFIPSGMTEVRYLENTIYKYLTLGITFALCISILIFANIKYKIKNKKLISKDVTA